MWENVLERYRQLQALDINRVIDGAHNHAYQFPPVAVENEITRLEEKFGVNFPPQLKSFYLEVGDGGPGPESTMFSLGDIVNLKAAQPWRGCDYYEDFEEDFEELYAGVLVIMGAGYAHENAIVTNGSELGKIIAFNSVGGWNFVQSDSLIDFYHEGLDGIFEIFNTIHTLIEAKQNIQTIVDTLEQRFRIYPEGALVRVATLVGIPFTNNFQDIKAISFQQTNEGKTVYCIEESAQKVFNQKIETYRQSGKSQQLAKLYKVN